MQKITPFLWYDGKAEEAAKLYVSLFSNSRIVSVSKGAIRSVSFELEGQDFIALDGGPHFTFSPAISLFVSCKTQKEVDRLWDGLSAGGEQQPCGWLKDRYGVSWQIVPAVLGKLLQDKDARKSGAVMQAMLRMKKLDIRGLRQAHAS